MKKIKLCAIVAMAENRVIGKNNQLIWHLPGDLKHFKAITMGKPMIMGRKSFESLPGVLPGRPHIVISRTKAQASETAAHKNVHYVESIEGAIELACRLAHEADQTEIFVTGGGEVYKQTLPDIERLYLTIVHQDYDGDTYFPKLEWDEWKIRDSDEEDADEGKGRPAFTMLTLDRL